MKKILYWIWLLVLAVAPYLGALGAGFVWDDYPLIVENPLVLSLNPAAIFSQTHMGLYSPLVFLSFAFEHALFGDWPLVYHLDNMFLHAANVLLVCVFARELGAGRRAAWVVAALFAVHPVHVESVAWVSERKDVLYGLFYWAALIFYIRFKKTGRGALYGASFVFGLLSLLSKPMAVTLPLMILAYECIYGKLSIGAIKRVAPFIVPSAMLAGMTFFWFHADSGIRPEFMTFESVRLASSGVLFYFWKVLWPVGLSAVYPFPQPGLIYTTSPLIVAAALSAILWFARKNRAIFFGVTFFFISLLPVIQLVPVGNTFAADRYLYVALFGLLFAAVVLASSWLELNARFKSAAPVMIVAVLAGAFALTVRETRDWKNDFTLWGDALKSHPDSALAYYNRGHAYHLAGYPAEAIADYEAALDRQEDHRGAYLNRCVVLGMVGRLDESGRCFETYLRDNPDDHEAHYNRGVLHAIMQNYGDAKKDFERTLELKPDFAVARERLASVAGYVKMAEATKDD